MITKILFIGLFVMLAIIVCGIAFIVAISTADEHTNDDVY
jgi:hypothetical protein